MNKNEQKSVCCPKCVAYAHEWEGYQAHAFYCPCHAPSQKAEEGCKPENCPYNEELNNKWQRTIAGWEEAKEHFAKYHPKSPKAEEKGCQYIFPDGENNKGELTFSCIKCGRTFFNNKTSLSCAVVHSEGTCCHYGAKELPKSPTSDEGKKISYLQVGNTIECGACYPGKYEHCAEIRKRFPEWEGCNCKCHTLPLGGWAEEFEEIGFGNQARIVGTKRVELKSFIADLLAQKEKEAYEKGINEQEKEFERFIQSGVKSGVVRTEIKNELAQARAEERERITALVEGVIKKLEDRIRTLGCSTDVENAIKALRMRANHTNSGFDYIPHGRTLGLFEAARTLETDLLNQIKNK